VAVRTATKKELFNSGIRNDGWCSAILIVVLVIVPLAILPARFDSYVTTPKLAILYVSSALLLWDTRRWAPSIAALWRTRVGRWFYLLLIIGAGSLLISSACSGDRWLSFAGTVWRRLGAMSQLIVFFIGAVIAAQIYMAQSILRKLMMAIEGAGAAASIYAILQYAGWDPFLPSYLYKIGSPPAVRPPATLGQATYFATFLLPVIFIAAAFRLREGASSVSRRAHEFVILLSIAALVLSGTRSALLGLGAGSGAFLYMRRARLFDRRSLTRAAYLVASVSAMIALLLAVPAGAGLRVRVAQWATDWAGGPRLMVWRDSLLLFRRHAVWGIGPEMFEAEFRRAESLELARAFPDHYHESPHNFFIEAGLSEGALGVSIWVALLILAGWCALAGRREGRQLGGALSASLVGMLTSLQFSPLTITNELYVLVIIAALVALAAQPVSSGALSVVFPSAVIPAAVVVGVGLLLIGGAFLAQEILYQRAASQIADADLAGAERCYDAARKFPIPGPNLELSRLFASLARQSGSPLYKRALADAREAAAAAESGSAERFNALYQSAMLAIVANDFPRAKAKLQAAIDAAPTWYRPRMMLASVLWRSGKNQDAAREASLALKCAGRDAPDVKQALDESREHAANQVSR